MGTRVGFIPRSNAFRFPRVAERRLNMWRDKSVQPSVRDGEFGGAANRGLKPTATIMKSLRDCALDSSQFIVSRFVSHSPR
jgi:hypothetical protein